MAPKKKSDSKRLFRRLSNLFKTDNVRKKISNTSTLVAVPDKTKSSGAMLFQKSATPSYAVLTGNAFSLAERLPRFQDYVEMDSTAEISATLDIMADETVSVDDKGISLRVFSNDEKIKETLEDLFYNIINIEFNLRSWTRNLLKFGDLFTLIDVHPERGVERLVPIPVNEIEREENYDKNDPFAVRFKWVTLGNRTLENWEVAHFRLLGNDQFLPYGCSVIEGARKIWRQLILAEDAMLVYRVVRAPERRVFYIDIGNLAANEIEAYMQKQKQQLRNSAVIDRESGKVDLRYAPLNLEEDYFIPTRGAETGTKIDTLAGGQNAAAVEDVIYLQKKLIAALKIPRSYLGYEEDSSAKATLAQLDIRFSRTISVIQRTIIAELNKVAMIHLLSKGYTEEDLTNFTLRLNNPSTIAQQQKLELIRGKAEIAGLFPDNMVSKRYIRSEIFGFDSNDIKSIDQERLQEKLMDMIIEAAVPKGVSGAGGEGSSDTGSSGGGGGGGGGSLFGDEGGAAVGGEASPDLGTGGESGAEGGSSAAGGEPGGASEEPEENEETPGEENASDTPEDEEDGDLQLLTSSDDNDGQTFTLSLKKFKDLAPLKADARVRADYNRSRRRHHGSSTTAMPDMGKMLSVKNRDNRDVFDSAFLRKSAANPLGEGKATIMIEELFDKLLHVHDTNPKPSISYEMRAIMNKLQAAWRKQPHHSSGILTENVRTVDEVDVNDEDDILDLHEISFDQDE